MEGQLIARATDLGGSMNPALFFSLWCFAFGSLFTGSWFIHKTYSAVMKAEALQFQADWQKLERDHAKI